MGAKEQENLDTTNLARKEVQPKYIDGVHEDIGRYQLILDQEALDIVLSVAVANFLPGDPVWLLLVGPPGGGKTELLNMFSASDKAMPISKFTKRTLLTGDVSVAQGHDLLFDMRDKLVIIKDLAPIMEMGKDDQREILSDLRDAYDGLVIKSWGTGRTTRWEGKFGLIAACTDAIDKNWKLFSELGERFLRVNLKTNSKAQTAFAMQQVGSEDMMRSNLRRIGKDFLDHYAEVANEGAPHAHADVISLIMELGVLVARLRSPVTRDGSKNIVAPPKAEVGTRLSKQLLRLSLANALLYESPEVTKYGEYRIALRAALDCIPIRRVLVLSSLINGDFSVGQIAERTTLPRTTIQYELEDLRLLRVTQKLSTGSGWGIDEETMAAMRNTGVAGYVSRNIPPSPACNGS